MGDCVGECEPLRDGQRVNEFIAEYLSDCVYTNTELVAFLVGMSSLGFWLCCQAPQFLKNIQNQSAEALSVWFLLEWFGGDILNLVGAVLSGQQATQIFTAGLFVLMDIAMLSQKTYYHLKASNQQPRRRSSDPSLPPPPPPPPGEGEAEAEGNPAPALELPLALQHSPSLPDMRDLAAVALAMGLPAVAEAVAGESQGCEREVDHSQQLVGWWLGWVSAFMYLNSRLPQVLKNFRKKFAGGLSKLMFLCAVMGNVTYALGVVIRIRSWSEYRLSLPWLVGSVGTVAMDFVIIFQVSYYSHHQELPSPTASVSSGSPRHSAQYSECPGPLYGSCVPCGRSMLAAMGHDHRVGHVHPVYLIPKPRNRRLSRSETF